MSWITSQIAKVEKDRMQGKRQEDDRPDCPNCGISLMKMVDKNEVEAINQLSNILGILESSMLDSDSKMVDEGEIELQMPAIPQGINNL